MVLSFEVDPYTDIDIAELPFSLDDLQHLRHHFEVFSTVSFFDLTTDEKDQGQNQTPITNGLDDNNQKEARSGYMAQEQVRVETHDNQAEDVLTTDVPVLDNPEDNDQDPMGPSVLENMETSMVHVLPVEFQPTTHQPNFLDGDMVAEEATQVDFITNTEDEQANNDAKLKTALAKLFPRSSSANLQHLKPLYVTAHIEGYPISKIFVDCGATVNIMPISVMKALRRSNEELIPLGITMSSFVGD
ncbi:hypothetical protein ACFX2F_022213 [Malus domestica]